MPKYTFLIVFLLSLPLTVFAAYNTVQFTEDTNIYLGNGLTMRVVSGSQVAEMTVGSASVTFDMESGSTVTVRSYGKKYLPNNLGIQADCLESYSQVSLTSKTTQSFTITPNPIGRCGGGGGGIPISQLGDTIPPSISNIEVTTNDTTATVTWQTDESSLSWLIYGTSTDYGLEKKTTTYKTSHSVTLEELTPETTYHYQLKSQDSDGNTASYTGKTFTTLALGEAPEVVGEEEEEEEEEITLPEVTLEKPVSEMTVAEIKAKITEIMEAISQLEQLLSKIEETKRVYTGIPSDFTFDKNLKYGQTSDEVKYLQIILKQEVGAPTYPEDVPATGWFGPITKNSVIEFQEKYDSDILAPWELTQGTGFVGKTTRTKLNEIISR